MDERNDLLKTHTEQQPVFYPIPFNFKVRYFEIAPLSSVERLCFCVLWPHYTPVSLHSGHSRPLLRVLKGSELTWLNSGRRKGEGQPVKDLHCTGFPFILFKFILQLHTALPLDGCAVSYTENSVSTSKGRPEPLTVSPNKTNHS